MVSEQETVGRRSAIRTALGAGAGLILPACPGARQAHATHNPGTAGNGGAGSAWPAATPGSVGLDKAKLLEAQAYATRFAGGAGCVIRDGKLAHSWGVFTRLYPINSATKTWGSVVLGFAVDDDKVAVAGRVRRHLPNLGYKPTSNAGTGWLDEITLAQLATHTAGFPEPGGYGALQARPGTRFIYSNCGTNWLANALTNVFRQDLRQLTSDRLFTPLGLTSTDIRWRTPAGNFPDPVYGLPSTDFNGGMQANVNAMARLGYLYLRGGSWDGRRIVSSSYVGLSTGPYYSRIPISTLKGHGLLWWNNAGNRHAGVPRDMYHSLGKNDNLTIVIPSLDMVVVRIGTDGWRNHGGTLAAFLKPIVDAVM